MTATAIFLLGALTGAATVTVLIAAGLVLCARILDAVAAGEETA